MDDVAMNASAFGYTAQTSHYIARKNPCYLLNIHRFINVSKEWTHTRTEITLRKI
jgi:hypothetical protein